MRGPARLATYLGRVLMVAGFVLIVLAWNGAAGFDRIQQQFPYLLSGALPGLAFVIVGAGTEYVQAVRQYSAKRAKQMAEINLVLVKLVGVVREDGGLRTAPETEPAPVPVAAGAHAAVQGGQTTGAVAVPADAAGDRVVAGRSSFHAPECHLVSERDDMATITRLEAEGQGLSPCRVCKP